MGTLEVAKEAAYCRAEGCFNLRKRSSFCPGHAHQYRLGRRFYAVRNQHLEPWDYPRCSFNGCSNWQESATLCGGHAAQLRREGRLAPLRMYDWQAGGTRCAHARCGASAQNGGFCLEHYSVQAAPLAGQMGRIKCAIQDCIGTFADRSRSGLCKNHAMLARIYGLTPAELSDLYSPYECAICHTTSGRLHIDHDHSCCPSEKRPKCGKCVRGLLCMHCNHLIGNAREDASILAAAISYIGLPRLQVAA